MVQASQLQRLALARAKLLLVAGALEPWGVAMAMVGEGSVMVGCWLLLFFEGEMVVDIGELMVNIYIRQL